MNRITTIVAALALCAGCAHNHTDDHWGESQRTLSAQQIQNPEASDEKTPVVGMGSSSAVQVTANYHARQREQAHDDHSESLLELIQD